MDAFKMFAHSDLLGSLNEKKAITEKIDFLHLVTQERYAFIDRIAVAMYDAKCDLLKTFSHSTDIGNPLPHYQAKLSAAKSLSSIVKEGKPRIVNDISVFDNSTHRHAQQIKNHGFKASYTVPLFQNSEFIGFVFFNSRQKNVFTGNALSYLDMIARLLSFLVADKVGEVKTLQGALKTATEFTGHRDPETGAHLERMARFARVIAREMAVDEGFDDEYVERLFWYAPLHDVGKIAIPDHILLKNGRLTDEEFSIMKTHADKGSEIISKMLGNFNLTNAQLIPQLINIVRSHHENIDGSGYPDGLSGSDIPAEARIVAVADVFDALTSERPYKKAWSNDEAFAELWRLTSWKLDEKYVAALEKNRIQVEEIQQQFQDETVTWSKPEDGSLLPASL
jgi:HD-GYP domain-containing protein (c-di-GMP phosphodiesterase class II)